MRCAILSDRRMYDCNSRLLYAGCYYACYLIKPTGNALLILVTNVTDSVCDIGMLCVMYYSGLLLAIGD